MSSCISDFYEFMHGEGQSLACSVLILLTTKLEYLLYTIFYIFYIEIYVCVCMYVCICKYIYVYIYVCMYMGNICMGKGSATHAPLRSKTTHDEIKLEISLKSVCNIF